MVRVKLEELYLHVNYNILNRVFLSFTGIPELNDDPTCNADFGFVADVSKSVEDHWEDEKNFMRKLVKSIAISEQGGRAAVTTFSHEAEFQIKFSDHMSYSTFETALEAIPYVGRTTRINLGLEVALDEMFQESNGMRSDVPQTMVLITDGQQTEVDFDLFREQFNKAGIRTLVIGVGNVRERDLRHLVNDDADFYKAEDFNELLTDEFIKSITFCGGRLLFIHSFIFYVSNIIYIYIYIYILLHQYIFFYIELLAQWYTIHRNSKFAISRICW